jgi:hypothetical protein
MVLIVTAAAAFVNLAVDNPSAAADLSLDPFLNL